MGHFNHSSHVRGSPVMQNEMSLGNNQIPCTSGSAQAAAELEPLPLPDLNASVSAASVPVTPRNQSRQKSAKDVMKVLAGQDRVLKETKRQPKTSKTMQTKKAATSKAPDPPATTRTPEPAARTVVAPAPVVSPEDADLLNMPLDPDEAHEDEHGEVTLQKYRKMLESYKTSNNIQAQDPSCYSDEDDLSVESFTEWPDEADRREERPEIDGKRVAKDSRGARAAPNSRKVDRHKSGQSMMSCKTLKSNATSLSGLSMLSDMMSMESSRDEDKTRDARRFSSNASIMSELTDISHTIDGLGLDDDY
jgi:hypothetical protein